MKGFFYFFAVLLSVALPARVRAAARASDYVAPHTYNNMYPYMTNKMRTNLTDGNTPNQNTAQIDVLTRTIGTDSRRVVPRRATNAARAGTGTTATVAQIAATPNTGRRVIPRATTGNTTGRTTARMTRDDMPQNNNARTAQIASDTTIPVSSARCLADYTACMDEYCKRENTAYNRCYCSAKLSQIDSEFQPAIDNLVMEMIKLQGKNNWSDAEMNEYWMDTVGKYSGENSWTNIDAALNIDWASTESRVRGQTAFNTGHEYCVQHLRGCFYMAANLRDAYRSEIARDCNSYESQLQRLRNAAESIVESYK